MIEGCYVVTTVFKR